MINSLNAPHLSLTPRIVLLKVRNLFSALKGARKLLVSKMKLFKTEAFSLHLNPCISDKIKGLTFKNWVQIGTFSERRSFRESLQKSLLQLSTGARLHYSTLEFFVSKNIKENYFYVSYGHFFILGASFAQRLIQRR